MIDDVKLEEMKEIAHTLTQSLQTSMEELDDVLKKSEMQVGGCAANQLENPLSVHFDFDNADANSRMESWRIQEAKSKMSAQTGALHSS